MTAPLLDLNDGNQMPALGFGTYKIIGPDAPELIGSAIDAGYRLLDTATRYDNEVEVGEAVRASSVPRDELFVTSKLPGADHGFDEARRSFEGSLERLGLDRLDLFLIHWPQPPIGKFVETWRAFIRLRDEGLVSSIGVSNFLPGHLDRLVDETSVAPAVNQIELHPFLPQNEQRVADFRLGTVTQSWTPLGRRTELLDRREITETAEKHGRTPAQVVLRWHLDLGAAPIPKSATPERFRSNLDVFDFALDDDDLERIATLETGKRIGGDPATEVQL
ncbi:aldo/keto reductase [Aeromicrobium sp.]|uniref:aldo/keto reductase n=1 Tax=Aeromicrobium sp. TaxID=1871063 RepID=UPI003D6BCE5F